MAGAHPADARDFAADRLPMLRQAVGEAAWLLERDYAPGSVVTLVGNHHQLTARQRQVVARCAVGPTRAAARAGRRVEPAGEVWIDGFNVLITVERALAGGAVLCALDGALRDVNAVYGSWHPDGGTQAAIAKVAAALSAVTRARWLLDAPVSNSGRLAGMLRAFAASTGAPWEVEVVASPDVELRSAPIAATADGAVIDRCRAWTDLAAVALVGVEYRRIELGNSGSIAAGCVRDIS